MSVSWSAMSVVAGMPTFLAFKFPLGPRYKPLMYYQVMMRSMRKPKPPWRKCCLILPHSHIPASLRPLILSRFSAQLSCFLYGSEVARGFWNHSGTALKPQNSCDFWLFIPQRQFFFDPSQVLQAGLVQVTWAARKKHDLPAPQGDGDLTPNPQRDRNLIVYVLIVKNILWCYHIWSKFFHLCL